ncbi:MAG: helix-hairpin-helix domain-containing protein [Bacillota bacterium]|nr:helix-hairpin-helix domain-containing protein [Bacillota bacterium]
MKIKYTKKLRKLNLFDFEKYVLKLLKITYVIVLKSRVFYFIILISVLILYRGGIIKEKFNNCLAHSSYEIIGFSNKNNNLEACKIPLNTVEYCMFPTGKVTEVYCDEDFTKETLNDSKEFIDKKLTTSLSIDNRRAYGNKSGKGYTITEFNRLSVEELETFYGVGNITARAIYTLRESRGGFRSFEELLDVKGIGFKKFHKIMGGEHEKKTDGND